MVMDRQLQNKLKNHKYNRFVLRMEFCEKGSWFLANITNGVCPVVSIFYWTFLFPQLDLAMSFDVTFLHLFNTLW